MKLSACMAILGIFLLTGCAPVPTVSQVSGAGGNEEAPAAMASANTGEVSDGFLLPRASSTRAGWGISVMRPPHFTPVRTASGELHAIDMIGVEKEFRSLNPHLHLFKVHTPGKYLAVSPAWLKEFLLWYRNFLYDIGVHDHEDAWDCDNYSHMFSALAAFQLYGEEHSGLSLAIGHVTVFKEHSWGGVPAGKMHELVTVVTDQGIHIVEPQTGQITPISEYPNKNFIRNVVFE